MQQAFQSYSPETLERLKKQGLTEYKPQPLSAWQNPHSSQYLNTSYLLFGICLVGRYFALKQGAPRFVWSMAAVSLPFFQLCTRSRLDQQDTLLGKRKTLEDNLEFNPVTRRAWEKALEKNQEYQEELKQEIEQLRKRR